MSSWLNETSPCAWDKLIAQEDPCGNPNNFLTIKFNFPDGPRHCRFTLQYGGGYAGVCKYFYQMKASKIRTFAQRGQARDARSCRNPDQAVLSGPVCIQGVPSKGSRSRNVIEKKREKTDREHQE